MPAKSKRGGRRRRRTGTDAPRPKSAATPHCHSVAIAAESDASSIALLVVGMKPNFFKVRRGPPKRFTLSSCDVVSIVAYKKPVAVESDSSCSHGWVRPSEEGGGGGARSGT